DELAAARYRKAAAVLDRPAQPKRGRVLEHGGPECAPGQARVWERYEKALVERQAAIDAVLSAEREAERLRAEIARERQREERRAAAKREREASHGGWPDGMAVARGVLAYLEALGRAYRQEVRTRWERRQAERRVAIEAQRRVEQERQERRRQLLGLAASLAADAECRLRLREAYEAAGFRLEQRPDGKWVFVYPYRDLPEERQAVREARRAWDERRMALEAERVAAWEAEERRRQAVERDRVTEQEQGPGVRHPDKPRWQVERERILTEVYGTAVAERMGRWYRIERRVDALVLSNREAAVTDFGDRVVAHEGNDKEIEALVLLAQAKGWKRVTLTGSQEFQERAAQAFVKAGIALEDQALEARAKEALARQRREDIRERALLRQGYRRDAWEIRERWHWRQQERARRLEAERELARIEEEAEQARDAWRTVWRETGHLVDADARAHVPWGVWREQTLAERYGPEIAARAEAEHWYTRLRPDLGGLDISRNGQEVVDAGAALQVCSAGSMSLAVDLVRAKGWKRVAIGGPEDFRERAARALVEAGMVLADEALEQRAKAALDAERMQQERERALRRAMEGIKAHRIRWRRKDGTIGEQRALDYLEDGLLRGFTIQETAEGFRWWSADGKPGAVVGDEQLMALFRAAKAADQDLGRVVERIRMEVGMPNAAAERARGRTVTPKRGLGDDWW
ncbi:LPD7 domain-containing protein, partial [Acidithiobacillus caldus]